MRKRLFHQRLLVAFASAAALALTACGGGAENGDVSAPQARAQTPNAADTDTDTAASAEQPASQDLAAADEGAAHRERQ